MPELKTTIAFAPTVSKAAAGKRAVSNNVSKSAERALHGGFRRPVEATPGEQHNAGMQKWNQSTMEPKPVTEVAVLDGLLFNCWVTFTVVLNVIVIGLEQDLGPGNVSPGERMVWFMLEVCFCAIFLVELLLRVVLNPEGTWKWFQDAWNLMDLTLVLASALDSLFLGPVGVGGWVRYFTVLRTLRAVKLVRLIQMFPVFRELWLLVGGLVNSLKALGWVGLIVVMVLYVCGIVVTAEIGKNDEVYAIGPSYDGEVWPYKKYFGTVWRSMFTLFQVLTLDSWCDGIVRHVVYRQPYMGVFFVLFLLLTAFGLINVVIGIIVENTLAAAQVTDRRTEEKEAQLRREAVEHLSVILDKSDIQRLGEISLEELKAANNSKIVTEKFDRIGLSFEEVEEIFKLLDYEQRGRVELKRLAASCLELVGGAKRRDIAQVEVTIGSLAQHLDQLDSKFSKIEAEVSGLTSMAEEFVQTTVRLLTGFDGQTAEGQGQH